MPTEISFARFSLSNSALYFFSYLELSELRSCALVCKHWYRCLHGDENSEVWRSLCARSLAEEALRTDITINCIVHTRVRAQKEITKPDGMIPQGPEC